MNRIEETFKTKKNILNIYYTAGFPKLEDTIFIAETLQKKGVDMIEIGIPFSDPIADGTTIQESSTISLKNGMTLNILFQQLKNIRKKISIPILLMGYVNPILQYGISNFCQSCAEVGIDGVIIPDLPMDEFLNNYQSLFLKHKIYNIFLITPNTSDERIRRIDNKTQGFIYMVSSASITGARSNLKTAQVDYYQRIQSMKLKNPKLIGFGISNQYTFDIACQYAQGAIIGSAFINVLKNDASEKSIQSFIQQIKPNVN